MLQADKEVGSLKFESMFFTQYVCSTVLQISIRSSCEQSRKMVGRWPMLPRLAIMSFHV